MGLLASIHAQLEICVSLAAQLAHVPIAWVCLLDLQCEPIVIGVGCASEKLQQLNQVVLNGSHASYASMELLSVPTEPLFHPLLNAAVPDIRFGAVWPLVDSSGFRMGHFCLGDYIQRRLEPEQLVGLDKLVQHVAWVVETDVAGGAIAPEAVAQQALQSKVLWQTNQQLRLRIESLQEEHFCLTQLNNFMDALQNYATLDEVFAQLPALLQATFPNQSGRLYVSNYAVKGSTKIESSPEYTEVLSWGMGTRSVWQKLPMDCLVVQNRRPCYSEAGEFEDGSACSICKFSEMLLSQDHLCVPLMDHASPQPSIITGVFSLALPSPTKITHLQRQMVTQVAHHLGKVLTRLKQYELIHVQSIRDALTGLFNRRYLFEVLPKILQRAQHGHYSVGIIVFDIDHFKRFNDCYGHLAGDKVLQDFGVFLKGFVRGTDIACRYGGEEFMLVLPEATLERVIQRANRLRQGMHYMKMEYQGKPLGKVTISAGVASFPHHGSSAEQVIAAADAALYQAKADGRDRISVAQQLMN